MRVTRKQGRGGERKKEVEISFFLPLFPFPPLYHPPSQSFALRHGKELNANKMITLCPKASFFLPVSFFSPHLHFFRSPFWVWGFQISSSPPSSITHQKNILKQEKEKWMQKLKFYHIMYFFFFRHALRVLNSAHYCVFNKSETGNFRRVPVRPVANQQDKEGKTLEEIDANQTCLPSQKCGSAYSISTKFPLAIISKESITSTHVLTPVS